MYLSYGDDPKNNNRQPLHKYTLHILMLGTKELVTHFWNDKLANSLKRTKKKKTNKNTALQNLNLQPQFSQKNKEK